MSNDSHTAERDGRPSPEGVRISNEPKAQQETTPAEERGERIATGRSIARGGRTQGVVPGASGEDPNPERAGQKQATGAEKATGG